MALIQITLPKCDVCGEVWLPQDVHARTDPRGYDAERRARGEPRLRCGKCKSPQWDRNYTGDRRRKGAPPADQPPEPENEASLLLSSERIQNGAGLESLYGIFEEEFKALGGGEAFLRAERESWGPDPWERLAIEKDAESRKAG